MTFTDVYKMNLQEYLAEDRMFYQTEFCARLSEAMLSKKKIILKTKEGKSLNASGLFKTLDTLCEIFNYPKANISIENNNWSETHNEYQISQSPFSFEFCFFAKENIELLPYNGEKFFGLFIGRADRNRIHSLILSKRLKIPHLSSFNHNLWEHTQPNIAEYIWNLIQNTDITLEEIKQIRQFSDVDEYSLPPIVPPKNSFGNHWSNVYKKIAIEVVNETTLYPNSFHITEKTLRPIYYKRPFIMIGAKNYLQNLRNIGFKTFNQILPNHDDAADNPVSAFYQLEKIYNRYTGQEILEICKNDIEKNYNLLLKLSKDHQIISNDVGGLNYFDK